MSRRDALEREGGKKRERESPFVQQLTHHLNEHFTDLRQWPDKVLQKEPVSGVCDVSSYVFMKTDSTKDGHWTLPPNP